MIAAPPASPTLPADEPREDRARWLPWVGALGSLLLTLCWLGRPQLWTDEAATISASTRSLPQLFALVGNIDGVHALFYLLLWGWVHLTGVSEVAVRLPAALAAAAAVGVAAEYLRRRLGPVQAGCGAALMFFLPRVLWSGTEARSYSLILLCAVLSGIALARWMRTGRGLLAYGVAALFGLGFSVLTATLIFTHLLIVLLYRPRRVLPFLGTCGVLGLCCLPLVLLSTSQQDQVSWIPTDPETVWHGVVVEQFFTGPIFGNSPVAPWLLLAAYLILAAVAILRSPHRRLVVAGVLWVLVPTLSLAWVTLHGHQLYTPRYLIFTVPGLILLGVLGVERLPRRWGATVATGLVVLLCLPGIAAAASPTAKDRTVGYRQFAELEATTSAVLYTTAQARGISIAYPERTRQVRDVFETGTPAATDSLWGTVASPARQREIAERITGSLTLVSPPYRNEELAGILRGHCRPGAALESPRYRVSTWDCD